MNRRRRRRLRSRQGPHQPRRNAREREQGREGATWLAGKPPSSPPTSVAWSSRGCGGREAQLASCCGMEGAEEGRRSSPAVAHGGH